MMEMGDRTLARTHGLLDASLLAGGLVALLCLLAIIGWPLSGPAIALVHSIMLGVLAVFVTQEVVRLMLAPSWRAHCRSHWMQLSAAVLVVLEVVIEPVLAEWMEAQQPGLNARTFALAYLAGTQTTALLLVGLHGIRRSARWSLRGISPSQLLLLSFALLILGGSLLLMMPNASSGNPIRFIDALFTSTSAVCVTGLVVVDPSTGFSRTGQILILLLVQAGGVGLMTFTCFIALVVGGKVSLRERMVLRNLLSEESLGQVTSVLGLILLVTFAFELVGTMAVFASLRLNGYAQPDILFVSLFHAVSGYCNAGFSLFSSGLQDARVYGNTALQITLIILLVCGGLGFPVLRDLGQWGRSCWRRRVQGNLELPARLRTHTRLVLTVSAALLLGGSLVLFLTDFVFHAGESNGGRVLTAVFNAATSRTAGFNTVDPGSWSAATVWVILLLMYVGGSPGSMAGGIKTTVFAVAVMNTVRILRNARELVLFRRRIDESLCNRAFAIVLLSAVWVAGTTLLLSLLHPSHPPLDVVFEVVSAFSTVGLSRGLTAELGDGGKLILCLTMLVGRIGVLMFLFSIVHRAPTADIHFPEDRILLN